MFPAVQTYHQSDNCLFLFYASIHKCCFFTDFHICFPNHAIKYCNGILQPFLVSVLAGWHVMLLLSHAEILEDIS